MSFSFPPVKYNPVSRADKATRDRSKQAGLEKFLMDNYNLQINVLNGKFYQKKGTNMGEINDLNILRECRLMNITTSKQRIIETLLSDNFCPRFNPVEHFLKHLPAWNGEHDHISHLASFVKLQNEKQDRARFDRHFKKMFVRSVFCGLGKDRNKHVIVFIGGQHKGKTSFCEYLCPEPLADYRITILPNQTIAEKDIALKFWAVMDEMGKFTPRQLEVNKAVLTLEKVYFKFFDKYEQPMIRHCNFTATTNYTEIFNDETGNSRFIPFEIADIDWRGYNNEITIADCWSQAFKMYDMISKKTIPYNYNLDATEILENEKTSLMYQVNTPAMRLIRKYFDIPDNDTMQRAEFMNASMVLDYFNSINALRYEDRNLVTANKLGQALKTLRFPETQKWDNGRHYQIKGYYIIKI